MKYDYDTETNTATLLLKDDIEIIKEGDMFEIGDKDKKPGPVNITETFRKRNIIFSDVYIENNAIKEIEIITIHSIYKIIFCEKNDENKEIFYNQKEALKLVEILKEFK